MWMKGSRSVLCGGVEFLMERNVEDLGAKHGIGQSSEIDGGE